MLSHMYTEIAERLEDDNDWMRSVTLCKVCQTSEVNVLFLPCGHLVACSQVSFFSSTPPPPSPEMLNVIMLTVFNILRNAEEQTSIGAGDGGTLGVFL